MKIQNTEALATTDLRRAALAIAEAGFVAIDTQSIINKLVAVKGDKLIIGTESFPEHKGGVYVVAVGKCAIEAGVALERILGERLTAGIALDIRPAPAFKKIRAFQGTHPLPSEANIEAAAAVVELLRAPKEDDLVIFVVSGGGSTLLCFPKDAGCELELEIMRTLTVRGAPIKEVNVVRKHLSLARGGHLAQYAYPARVISLIFSDVPGDPMGSVASGPTIRDGTSVKEAEEILRTYNIYDTLKEAGSILIETPKEEKYFKNVTHILAATNDIALKAMEKKAAELGFSAQTCTACLEGEARDVGITTVEALHTAPQRSAFIYGGETTVTIKGHGRGGRNLEMALSALRKIGEDELVLPFASDGRDNGEFAGAICDTITKKRADELTIDIKAHLDTNNEYPFFEEVGNYLMTGDTGSNIADLLIALKG